MPMSRNATSRHEARARRRAPRAPSCATRTSWPSARSSMREARREVARCRRRPGRGARGRRRPRRAAARAVGARRARARAAGARRTRCPCPARRCAPRSCRRAARPAARASVRPTPRPAVRALERAVDLREHARRSLVEHRGVDADAVVAHARPRPRRPRAARRSAMRPPGSVYFAALLSRFENTCARRVASPSTGSGSRGSATSSAWPRASMNGRAVSTRVCARTSRSSTRSCRSASLPVVMRDTSSRSSTSRTIWRSWRSIISRARRATARGRRRASLQDLERVAQRRERVAQLVRERREELVLAPVGVAQRLLGAAPLDISRCSERFDASSASARCRPRRASR